MKKLIVSTLAATVFAAMAPAAQAVTVGPTNFTVAVNLTSACSTPAAPANLDFGVYTGLTGALSAPTTSITVNCTRGLPVPTYTFDAAKGGTDGVIAGLNYTLSAAEVVTAGITATPGVAGTADSHVITITGNMPANQAGEGIGGAATDVRTLTIVY